MCIHDEKSTQRPDKASLSTIMAKCSIGLISTLIGIPVADPSAGPTWTTRGFVSNDLEDDRPTLFRCLEKLGSL